MRGEIPEAGWIRRDMGWLIAAARIGKAEENNGSLQGQGAVVLQICSQGRISTHSSSAPGLCCTAVKNRVL